MCSVLLPDISLSSSVSVLNPYLLFVSFFYFSSLFFHLSAARIAVFLENAGVTDAVKTDN